VKPPFRKFEFDGRFLSSSVRLAFLTAEPKVPAVLNAVGEFMCAVVA